MNAALPKACHLLGKPLKKQENVLQPKRKNQRVSASNL
jgi:hypothetical protein